MAKRRHHKRSQPHRILFRTARGEDVKAFKRGLNARLKHVPDHLRHGTFTNPGARLDPDNPVFTDQTFIAWQIVREAIGLPLDHPPTRGAQLNVRRPWTRSPAARRRAKRRRTSAAGAKPKIITANQIGLSFQWVFGATGPIFNFGWHYSAGGRAANGSELIALTKSFHAYHGSLGWGGVSYPYLIADDGTLLLGNPVNRKSAQVAGMNSGMAGVCCPGTLGDRLTPRQKSTIAWIKAKGHTHEMPKDWRLPKPAAQMNARGHKEFPGQSTSCPDAMLPDYRKAWA